MSAATVTGDGRVWVTITRGLRLSPELRHGLRGTLALALLATAGRAIVPVAVQRTIDRGLAPGQLPGEPVQVDLVSVAGSVAMAAVAVLVTALASRVMNVRLAQVTETALSNLRVRAFGHIHDLSMLHQASEQRGVLVARVTTDVDEISRFMQWGGLHLLTSAGQVAIAILVMALYSWQLTVLVVGLFVPFVLLARWFQTQLSAAYLKVRERIGVLLGAIAESVVGAPVVRAYGIEERTGERLDTAIEAHRSAAVRAGGLSAAFSATGELFGGLTTAAVVVVGVLLGVDGTLTAGTVLAFLFLIQLFVEPVQIAGEALNEAQTAVAGWRRVLDVLDLEPDVTDPADGVDLPDGPISISFDGVSFRYPRPGEPARAATGPVVLADVHVQVAPRERIAVVGETGSGKTTFSKLLTRLMDPAEGRILLNGVPVDRIRFDSLRDRVVMVPQDGSLFDGTIADNIRQGRPAASDADLRLAFLELGLTDWLEELPSGFATEVGERGSQLSAGERQLVALARAYVANPDLLVLDEATSAVDPATEVRLQRALHGLTAGRTTVTVAHRLSTAESADRILVFEAGRVVEEGTHDALVGAGGAYAALHASWRSGLTSPDRQFST